jgi:hypothetical protein
MRIRFLIAVGSALAALALSASSAFAQSSEGAQTLHIPPSCETNENGTFCSHFQVMSNVTSTPSGGSLFVANSWYEVSFVAAPGSGFCSGEQSGQTHFIDLYRPPGSSLTVRSYLDRQEFSFPNCEGGGDVLVCVTEWHFQNVNGVLVFNRLNTECTVEPAP